MALTREAYESILANYPAEVDRSIQLVARTKQRLAMEGGVTLASNGGGSNEGSGPGTPPKIEKRNQKEIKRKRRIKIPKRARKEKRRTKIKRRKRKERRGRTRKRKRRIRVKIRRRKKRAMYRSNLLNGLRGIIITGNILY